MTTKSVVNKLHNFVDLRIYYPDCYGPFNDSKIVLPFDCQASLEHVLDLGKYLTNFANIGNPFNFNYMLSVDALAHLVCVDSVKLRRFRSTSSVLDKFGIASNLKMVVDNINWALDDCEKAFEVGDFTHLVATVKQTLDSYAKKNLLDIHSFLSLDDKEQLKVKIRRYKRQNTSVVNDQEVKEYYQLLASHELEVSTNLHYFADTLLRNSSHFKKNIKDVQLNESNILMIRLFATYPEYVNDVSFFDVPYAMFVDLLSDVINSKSYISYLLAKMPSQASRWMSERHAPKLETQRLINLLFHHFSQYKDDKEQLKMAVCFWRNLVGHTTSQFGRDLLEPQ